MKLLISLLALILSATSMARDGAITFTATPDNGETYTVYDASSGSAVEVGSGTESPVAISIDDSQRYAAFFVIAWNAKGQSDPSDIVEWQDEGTTGPVPPAGPFDIQVPPNTPIQININMQ